MYQSEAAKHPAISRVMARNRVPEHRNEAEHRPSTAARRPHARVQGWHQGAEATCTRAERRGRRHEQMDGAEQSVEQGDASRWVGAGVRQWAKSAQGAPMRFPGWSPHRTNNRRRGAAPVGVKKQTRELGFWAVIRGQDQDSTRVETYPLERGCPTPRLDRLPRPPGIARPSRTIDLCRRGILHGPRRDTRVEANG